MNVLGSRLLGSVVGKRISSPVLRYFCAAASNIKDEIDKLVKSSKVVVFMKGTPEEPRCGFSSAVVQVLRMHGVPYDAHNVLERDELRNGIKEYSDWPTIPQVYISGEFVGGCDIMVKLHQTGDLVGELEKAGIKSALADAVSESEKKNENA